MWKAYEQLEKSKVRNASPPKLLTNIISLIRFAVGEYEILEPFDETVKKRFEEWLAGQEKNGRSFTGEQREWLGMFEQQVAASLSVNLDDFEYTPFYEKGGLLRFHQLFGADSSKLLDQIQQALV